MVLLGKHYTTNAEGKRITTLHISDEFGAYYSNRGEGRGCEGQKVETIYVGEYDCTQFAIGMNIEVLYDKAIQTKNGIYQPIKRIIALK